MLFRKIAGPMQIIGNSTTPATYILNPYAGGRLCKTLQYMVKIIRSSGAECQVGLEVQHGPEGDTFTSLESSLIPQTSVADAATKPMVLAGSVGQDNGSNTKVVGEWILPILKINRGTGSGDVWALVEVYEMRKPY